MNSTKERQTTTVPEATGGTALHKRKRVLLPFLLLAVVLGGGGTYWYRQHTTVIATNDAFIAADEVSVSSRVPGRIVVLGAEEGDTVHRGDTLLRLDDEDLLANMQKARASVRFLERSAEAAAIGLEKAENDFIRMEKQYNNGIVSEEQFVHVASAKKLAAAQKEMAEAQIASAKAELGIISTQISKTVVTAPFTGVIVRRWVLEGDVVQPGQAAYSLFDLDNVWITANYEETKLREIHTGMPVRIYIDAYPGVDLQGKVASIGKATVSQFSLIPANNASGNFTKVTQRVPVKIALERSTRSGLDLLPGLSASVSILVR
jgi:membrane fusion protein, multidrug efflux system